MIERIRPENNERKLFLKLTPEGEALKKKALAVPCAMQDCIRMTMEELLNKALFTSLRSGDLLADDHRGGCVLYEKRDQVQALLD